MMALIRAAYLCSSVALYSTGHWVGGTVLASVFVLVCLPNRWFR